MDQRFYSFVTGENLHPLPSRRESRERRTSERHPIKVNADYLSLDEMGGYAGIPDRKKGLILILSQGGALLLTNHVERRNALLELVMRDQENHTLRRLRGRIVRSERLAYTNQSSGLEEPYYRMGISFV